MIDGPTVVPAGRSQPPTLVGFISVRTTIGMIGCSRIDSLSTASSQASSPSSAARWVRASRSGLRPTSTSAQDSADAFVS